MDYTRNLQGWSGGTPTSTRGRSTTSGTRTRGRQPGARARSATPTKTSGRVLNAAADLGLGVGVVPAFAPDLATALGNIVHVCALAGFPSTIVDNIVQQAYNLKS